jgi:CheY-like chemotaxis protein/pSer/pThr/pTyr-binding forkhead associated (FHA) protein/CRP-like cAMP-binding protein
VATLEERWGTTAMINYYLVVQEGLIREKVFPVKDQVSIGRDAGNDIQICDQSVSKQHALVYLAEGEPVVKDLVSLNGTFVNGEQVSKSMLRGGDAIRVGNTTIRFVQRGETPRKLDGVETQEFAPTDASAEAGERRETPPSRRILEAISQVPLFAGFSAEQVMRVAQSAHLSVSEAGRTIARQGDGRKVLHVILDGKVRAWIYDDQGKETSISFLRENQAFDELSFLTGLPCATAVRAEEETLICELDFDAMQAIVDNSPNLKSTLEEYSRKLAKEWEARKAAAGITGRSKAARFQVGLPVEFSLSPTPEIDRELSEQVFRGRSTEVSSAEIRLRVEERALRKLSPGAIIRMTVSLPRSWGTLRCLGTLRDVSELKDDHRAVYLGVEFGSTAAAQAKILERFLGAGRDHEAVEKVLVVDDEAPIRGVLREYLGDAGYQVVEAANGAEALVLAEQERPDLIILDIRMPELDGVTTCKRLKASKKTYSIPIIIATAYGDTLAEALEAGADDFVNKPFQLEEIELRVRSLLCVRHLTDELERAAAYIGELQQRRSGH